MPLTRMSSELVGRLNAARFTYQEVGRTAGSLPPCYRHLQRGMVIGSGAEAYSAASAALISWQAHLRAGLRVSASTATAEPGTVVLLSAGPSSARISAPCRIVYVVNEPACCGFAYGTLPGHPESGEEAFLVERHNDGTVTFTITAFSRPATALAKMVGPLGLLIQRQITRRYLRALAN